MAFAEVFGMPLSIGEYEPVASRAGEESNLNNCSHDGGIGVDDCTIWLSPSEKELDTHSKIKKIFTIREIALKTEPINMKLGENNSFPHNWIT